MTQQPILRVRDLGIQRGGIILLDRVNWTIERGENWVVLGANGSGKTSLLRALGGYLPPTLGRIEVFGEAFGESDWRSLRQRIGIVSSSIAQLIGAEDTSAEIVTGGRRGIIGAWGRTPAADKTAALGLLRDLNAAHVADRHWELLSQGERQRVLIARALMALPKLLILDEPCAGLDPLARSRFLDLMEHFGASPAAPPLVFVTHHIEEIIPRFTHALLLKNGVAIRQGRCREVITSAHLSEIFDAPVRVRHRGGRYSLSISSPSE